MNIIIILLIILLYDCVGRHVSTQHTEVLNGGSWLICVHIVLLCNVEKL